MTAPRTALPSLCVVLTVLVVGTVGAGCSSNGSSGRPSTPATLQILTPAPNGTTGANVDLRLKLRRAEGVPAAQVGGTIRPDRGHIHVSVDGQITQMYYGVKQTVPNLTP